MPKKKKKTTVVEPSPPPEEVLAKPYAGLSEATPEPEEPEEDTPPED